MHIIKLTMEQGNYGAPFTYSLSAQCCSYTTKTYSPTAPLWLFNTRHVGIQHILFKTL